MYTGMRTFLANGETLTIMGSRTVLQSDNGNYGHQVVKVSAIYTGLPGCRLTSVGYFSSFPENWRYMRHSVTQ